MALETYSNLAQDELNGGISNVDVSATLLDASEFPSTGTFRIRIEDELIKVTARSSNVLTIVRGQEGTTAVSHASGSTVTQVLTREGLIALGTNLHRTDTFANRPAAGTEGRLFVPTDGMAVYRDDGSAWSSYGPLFPFVQPDDTLYSWVNQGAASVVTSQGGIYLSALSTGSSNNIHARVKTIPSAPYTVTCAFLPLVPKDDFMDVGMILRDGSGNLITFSVTSNSFLSAFEVITAVKYTGPTSSGTAYTTTPPSIVAPTWQVGPCMWFQIKDDNTNRMYRISNDGVNFTQILSTTRTDFMTPTQIGFYVNPADSTLTAGINVLSFTGG